MKMKIFAITACTAMVLSATASAVAVVPSPIDTQYPAACDYYAQNYYTNSELHTWENYAPYYYNPYYYANYPYAANDPAYTAWMDYYNANYVEGAYGDGVYFYPAPYYYPAAPAEVVTSGDYYYWDGYYYPTSCNYIEDGLYYAGYPYGYPYAPYLVY